MKNEPTAVTLRIMLEQPTAGVDFGLQEGHGSDYEVVGKQRSKGGDLEFEFTITAHTSKKPEYAAQTQKATALVWSHGPW